MAKPDHIRRNIVIPGQVDHSPPAGTRHTRLTKDKEFAAAGTASHGWADTERGSMLPSWPSEAVNKVMETCHTVLSE